MNFKEALKRAKEGKMIIRSRFAYPLIWKNDCQLLFARFPDKKIPYIPSVHDKEAKDWLIHLSPK